MSSNDVKHKVAELLRINPNTFDLEVYDEYAKDSFVLDDEYMERLHGELPCISTGKRFGNVLQNDILSSFDQLNPCDVEMSVDECEPRSLSNSNLVYNNPITAEEVSMPRYEEIESECFKKLLITTADTEQSNIPASHKFNCLKNSSKRISCPNSRDLPTSNDEIKLNICDPDTLYQPEDNRSRIVDSIDQAVQTNSHNVVNPVPILPNDSNTNTIVTLCTDWNKQDSYKCSPDVSGLIPREISSVGLSSPLQFVHDVQSHQKTKHDTDNMGECPDKKFPPYIMHIQGLKTPADKGKRILPRLRLPSSYRDARSRCSSSLDLVVAIIRESVTDSMRHFILCRDLLLLPDDTNEVKEAVNPIELNLGAIPIEMDGTFELSLRLVNVSSQSTMEHQDDRHYYELEEEKAKDLHRTPYDSRYFRLACTLAKDNVTAWDTLCLSDYIRPKQRLQT